MHSQISPSSDDPLVSFVILTYRQADVIGDAIAGALEQTYRPMEIVISDDASPDATFDAVRRAVDGYTGPHRIVLNRNSVNLGIAAHLDRAMALVSGKMVVVNAGDDRSLPERTARIMQAWEASGRRADVIHSACLKLGPDGAPGPVARPAEVMRTDPRPIDIARRYHHAIGAGLAWTPRIFDVFGPLSGHCLVEDHAIPFRAAMLGGLRYIDTPLVLKKPGGVANLEPPDGLWNRYFGTRLRDLDWIVTDYRQFQSDLDIVDFADKAEVAAVVAHMRARFEFERDIARAAPPARVAMLGRARREAAQNGDRHFLQMWRIYAFAPASLWSMTLRRRAGVLRRAAQARLSADSR